MRLRLSSLTFIALLLGPLLPPASAQTPPAKTPLNRGLAKSLLLDPKQFRSDEVLAVNLTPQAQQNALAFGFTVLQSEALPAFELTITRLRLPPGLSVADRFNFESDGVVPLYRYRIPEILNPATEQLPHTAPCTEEHCYGRAMTGWQPELSSCARDLRIGLVGGPIDQHHVAFRGVRMHARGFRQPHQLPAPASSGTAVLALLAGNRTSNTPGLIPEAEFFIADVFSADQAGTPLNVIAALHWMAQSAVDVVMLNFLALQDPLLHHAIKALAQRGAVLIAPAGDDGPDAPPVYPAAYKEVIAVTAIDKNFDPYPYANRGRHIDLAAPGVGIWTAQPGNKQAALSGTSLAAAFATAVIAATSLSFAAKSKEAVLSRLQYRALGRTGTNPIVGRGLLVAPYSCLR